MRIDGTKTDAGRRTLPLPLPLPLLSFAVTVLAARRGRSYLGQQPMVFPSNAGTWRDPDNFRAQRWARYRTATYDAVRQAAFGCVAEGCAAECRLY